MRKQTLTSMLPVRRGRKRTTVVLAVALCLLLCGFSWGVSFWSRIFFPFGEAVDVDLITGFDLVVSAEQLQTYLNEPGIADEILHGLQANLAGNVYRIEIPEFHDEPLGMKIVRIIADRLFS